MNTMEPLPRVRIDKRHRQVYRGNIEVAKASRAAAEEAGLNRTRVELINIRISQINGCAYCLHVHVRDALAGGETTQRIAVLPAWRDTTLFTPQERAALTLAESITTLPDAYSQDQDYAEATRTCRPQRSPPSAGSPSPPTLSTDSPSSAVIPSDRSPVPSRPTTAGDDHRQERTTRDRQRPRQPHRQSL